MIPLLDANILLRLDDPASTLHADAVAAVQALAAHGGRPITVPQTAYEFWTVATRPLAQNGLGLSTADCAARLNRLLTRFPLRLDSPALFTEWRTLVETYDCKGKVAHDTRYVAAMHTHGLTHLLTFNDADFRRFPGITVLTPAQVIAAYSLPPSP